MKSIVLAIAIILFSTLCMNAQLKVLANGNVGIGESNPGYKLDVMGPLRFGQWTSGSSWEKVMLDWSSNQYGSPSLYPQTDANLMIGLINKRVQVQAYQIWSIGYANYSDERIKDNITNLKNSLEKIKLLRGVSYNFKEEFVKDVPENAKNNLKKDNPGFIAQELVKVFPELVLKSDTDIYSINYIGLIPVLVEAIKEQQEQIEALKQQLTTNDLKSTSSQFEENSLNGDVSSLDQNNPNPFNQSTIIGYFLSDNINHAVLNIYNMNGLQIKSLPINSLGKGIITINGSELSAGMYLYSLIADGKEVDTKRMILTE